MGTKNPAGACPPEVPCVNQCQEPSLERRVGATDARSGVQSGQEGSARTGAKIHVQFYPSRTLLPDDTSVVSAFRLTMLLRGWEPPRQLYQIICQKTRAFQLDKYATAGYDQFILPGIVALIETGVKYG